MATEAIGSTQFSIGRVLGDSIGIYARNFVGFTFLALLIGLMNLLVTMFYVTPTTAQAIGQFNFAPLGVGLLVAMLTHSLTQAPIIYGTFQDLRGNRAGFADCVARGLASMVPVIVGTIILVVAVGFASLLLVIPGIILSLMWWVYIPAIVVERKSISDGFGRSQELTKGRRWSILGLAFIVGVLSYVVRLLVTLVSAAGSLGSNATVILSYAGTALIAAFGAALVAVGYYYLRMEKDGVDVNQIASVFD